MLCPGLVGVTEVDPDPKDKFVSFEVNLSNDKIYVSYQKYVSLYLHPSRA